MSQLPENQDFPSEREGPQNLLTGWFPRSKANPGNLNPGRGFFQKGTILHPHPGVSRVDGCGRTGSRFVGNHLHLALTDKTSKCIHMEYGLRSTLRSTVSLFGKHLQPYSSARRMVIAGHMNLGSLFSLDMGLHIRSWKYAVLNGAVPN